MSTNTKYRVSHTFTCARMWKFLEHTGKKPNKQQIASNLKAADMFLPWVYTKIPFFKKKTNLWSSKFKKTEREYEDSVYYHATCGFRARGLSVSMHDSVMMVHAYLLEHPYMLTSTSRHNKFSKCYGLSCMLYSCTQASFSSKNESVNPLSGCCITDSQHSISDGVLICSCALHWKLKSDDQNGKRKETCNDKWRAWIVDWSAKIDRNELLGRGVSQWRHRVQDMT